MILDNPVGDGKPQSSTFAEWFCEKNGLVSSDIDRREFPLHGREMLFAHAPGRLRPLLRHELR